MKILWVVNHLMPQVTKELGIESPTSGSWLVKLLDGLSKNDEIELTIVSPYNQSKKLVVNNINFYLVKTKMVDKFIKPTKTYTLEIEKLIEKIKPDLIHIHGTEFAFNNAFLNSQYPTVTSIQGLISEIIKNENDKALINKKPYSNYGKRRPLKIYTSELIKRYRNNFRAKSEINILRNSENIIGRTDWDRAHTYYINPSASYYKVQETIRNEFFDEEWEIKSIDRYSILCAGGYSNPLKGAHVLLEALSLLKVVCFAIEKYIVLQRKIHNVATQ